MDQHSSHPSPQKRGRDQDIDKYQYNSNFRLQRHTSGSVDVYQKVTSIPGPPSEAGTFALLTHAAKGEDIVLRAAFSGNNVDEFLPHRLRLPGGWEKHVKHVAAALQLRLGAPQDGHGKPVTEETLWSYHASHVEKKLAVFAVAVLLLEAGGPRINEATAKDLLELRSISRSWRGDNSPDFTIHVSRPPCNLCQKFVGVLSNVVGVPLGIKVSPFTQDLNPPQSLFQAKTVQQDAGQEVYDGVEFALSEDVRQEILQAVKEVEFRWTSNATLEGPEMPAGTIVQSEETQADRQPSRAEEVAAREEKQTSQEVTSQFFVDDQGGSTTPEVRASATIPRPGDEPTVKDESSGGSLLPLTIRNGPSPRLTEDGLEEITAQQFSFNVASGCGVIESIEHDSGLADKATPSSTAPPPAVNQASLAMIRDCAHRQRPPMQPTLQRAQPSPCKTLSHISKPTKPSPILVWPPQTQPSPSL